MTINNSTDSLTRQLKDYFSRWKQSFVGDVPSHLYACVDCPKEHCSQHNWEHCETRLNKKNLVERHKTAFYESQILRQHESL